MKIEEIKVGMRVVAYDGVHTTGTVDDILFVVNGRMFTAEYLTPAPEMAYDEKTLTALDASIKKWESILLGDAVDEGSDNCPLCQIFARSHCVGCPIYDDTGKEQCQGTPWSSSYLRVSVDENNAGYFVNMLNYLRDLRNRCRLKKADADGWIPWSGGEMPVAKGTIIDVRHRDGDEYFRVPAGEGPSVRWKHPGMLGDIVAYRICREDRK